MNAMWPKENTPDLPTNVVSPRARMRRIRAVTTERSIVFDPSDPT